MCYWNNDTVTLFQTIVHSKCVMYNQLKYHNSYCKIRLKITSNLCINPLMLFLNIA